MTWTGRGRIEWASIDLMPLDMVREHGGSLECPCGVGRAWVDRPGTRIAGAVTCAGCGRPGVEWTWTPPWQDDVPGHWMAL